MNLEEICINTRNQVDSAQVRDYWRAPKNDTNASLTEDYARRTLLQSAQEEH